MRAFTWDDAGEIALALLAKFPAQDPLRVRFTDLRNLGARRPRWLRRRPRLLLRKRFFESIQMAWWEEWKEPHAG